jgi:hypothetical protein
MAYEQGEGRYARTEMKSGVRVWIMDLGWILQELVHDRVQGGRKLEDIKTLASTLHLRYSLLPVVLFVQP